MPEKRREEPSLLAAEPFADRSTRSGKHISLRADPVVIRGAVGRPGSFPLPFHPWEGAEVNHVQAQPHFVPKATAPPGLILQHLKFLRNQCRHRTKKGILAALAPGSLSASGNWSHRKCSLKLGPEEVYLGSGLEIQETSLLEAFPRTPAARSATPTAGTPSAVHGLAGAGVVYSPPSLILNLAPGPPLPSQSGRGQNGAFPCRSLLTHTQLMPHGEFAFGSLLRRLPVHGYKGVAFQNWARSYGCCPAMHYQPTSISEIIEVPALARQQNKGVKVVGGGHSPSDIACTDGFLIHMGKMNRVLQVDTEKKQVTVEAGIHLADLHPQLDKHGLALSNLGAVSDVTAGGVIGTGTHNTGIKHSILATQVVALTLLTADGTILECSESSNTEVFQAVRVRLGCLGVILTITLQCVPQFHLQETSFPSTLREVLDNLDSHLKKSEYFCFLWSPHTENVSFIYQDHTNKEPPSSSASWFGDYAIGFHLLEFLLWIRLWTGVESGQAFSVASITAARQLYVPVSVECEPSEHSKRLDSKSLTTATSQPGLALRESSAASELSPVTVGRCEQGQGFASFGPTPRPYGKDVSRLDYWLAYQTIMKKVGGRPHRAKRGALWWKDFEKMYPAFPKFCAIREKLDPTGMFLNAYLEVFY
ncbi:LOW QUALITY PROTEIN: L-gulonolactone oxidase-like [Pteropus medius]|uniref:LOW QUALITY PROTEIN: L-gulonolactone oxidase-like n=1 Tax=Pteropus vampyrus TaxID=132908 RepID=UPI00196A8822|nr:LOW QUALITY PROTEIN: L-gulonolactone oxidase-like [Pteropus giganteus]